MKEGVSSVWLIGIVMIFILVFASYISITINYTNTFKIKNEVLTIIEKHKGMTDKVSNKTVDSVVKSGEQINIDVGALQTISLYLLGRGYNATGYCPNDGNTWYGVPDIYENSWEKTGNYESASSNKKYYYCFAKFNNHIQSGYGQETIYYKVRMFYQVEFPALSEWLFIKVEGITDEIYNPQESTFAANADLYPSGP